MRRRATLAPLNGVDEDLLHQDRDIIASTALFRHAHIALPPRAKQMAPPKSVSPVKSAPKRRGCPRCGAALSRISPKAA
jgi:hypothetical protein